VNEVREENSAQTRLDNFIPPLPDPDYEKKAKEIMNSPPVYHGFVKDLAFSLK
jgi:hypothetical protein